MVSWPIFMTATGQKITVFNTHLDYQSARARELSAQLIRSRLGSLEAADSMIFLTGDKKLCLRSHPAPDFPTTSKQWSATARRPCWPGIGKSADKPTILLARVSLLSIRFIMTVALSCKLWRWKPVSGKGFGLPIAWELAEFLR